MPCTALPRSITIQELQNHELQKRSPEQTTKIKEKFPKRYVFTLFVTELLTYGTQGRAYLRPYVVTYLTYVLTYIHTYLLTCLILLTYVLT